MKISQPETKGFFAAAKDLASEQEWPMNFADAKNLSQKLHEQALDHHEVTGNSARHGHQVNVAINNLLSIALNFSIEVSSESPGTSAPASVDAVEPEITLGQVISGLEYTQDFIFNGWQHHHAGLVAKEMKTADEVKLLHKVVEIFCTAHKIPPYQLKDEGNKLVMPKAVIERLAAAENLHVGYLSGVDAPTVIGTIGRF